MNWMPLLMLIWSGTVVVQAGISSDEDSLRIPPLEPMAAQASFVTQDGFRMQLLASEPLVTDPVAMEYDEFGRAWVVEMSDYPYTDKTTDKPFTEKNSDIPLGRVRVLFDDNGDGVFDRSQIFAESLSWPTGLAFRKGGLYVAATPELLYLKDTDGDFVADERRSVFTGFRKFNIQAVMNNLRWGPDHLLYGAGGSNGGLIVQSASRNAEPLRMGAQDFRFAPETESIELISGGARFGQAFDDVGNRFLCNIRNPIRHLVFDDRYLRRNPFSGTAAPIHDVAAAGDTLPVYRISQPEPWRALNAERLAADRASVSPRSETVAAGFVTSACGITVYRGSAYPAEYDGLMFLGEVAANVILRQRLVPEGPTYRAERLDDRTEFVCSTDNWFRPVNFVNAPDGTLHVVDMYRETIEHPWSIPDDLKSRLDLESGRDRGRIYRLAPPGFHPKKAAWPGECSTAALVAMLRHPDGWWRETAHRLLHERQDPECIPLLRDLLASRTDAVDARQLRYDALGRMLALWSLKGQGRLDDEDLVMALNDPSPIVREQALRLAEGRASGNGRIQARLLELVFDVDERVRCQAVFSVGEVATPEVVSVLKLSIRQNDDDVWHRAAIMTMHPDLMAPVLEQLLTEPSADAEAPMLSVRSLAAALAERGDVNTIRALLKAAGSERTNPSTAYAESLQQAVLLGLSDRLKVQNNSLTATIDSIAGTRIGWVTDVLNDAAVTARSTEASDRDRVAAVLLLGRMPYEQTGDVLLELLAPSQSQSVQFAAVSALARTGHQDVPKELLGRWKVLTPPTRMEAIQQVMSRSVWATHVLDALEQGVLSVHDIPTARRGTLLKSTSDEIRKRAELLLTRDSPRGRSEVVGIYQQSLKLSGNQDHGRELIRKHCQTCHRMNGAGHDIGPQLETIRHRSASDILLQVLDPNREVAPVFLEYVVQKRDGLTTTGLIESETPGAITLLRAEGLQETVPRSEIEELSGTGKSIMPEGFEKQLSVQDMADILAALRGL